MAARTGAKATGVVPKRDSQRRRRNTPKSRGAAQPATGVAAPAPPRAHGIVNPDPIIENLWVELQDSPESKFYSAADWARVRLELFYGNQVIRELKVGYVAGFDAKGNVSLGNKINSAAWKLFQDALTELLVSPAAKRRAGIELSPPVADPQAAKADAKIIQLAAALSGNKQKRA